jgi:cytochrome c-type biogenesis protein CcmE
VSKKLDQELADAIGAGDEAAAPAVATPAAPAKPAPRKNVAMLLTLLAMVGALTAFFFVGLKPAAVYAAPVEQILASPESYVGRKVRIEGNLVPGSLEKRDQPCEYRFRVSGAAPTQQLQVRYPTCVVPDTFRDRPEGGVEVTIEGALAKDRTFEATQLMAKCASKYDPKEHKMREQVSAR